MNPIHKLDGKQVGETLDGDPVFAFVPRWWQLWRWAWYLRQPGREYLRFHIQIAYLIGTKRHGIRTYRRSILLEPGKAAGG